MTELPAIARLALANVTEFGDGNISRDLTTRQSADVLGAIARYCALNRRNDLCDAIHVLAWVTGRWASANDASRRKAFRRCALELSNLVRTLELAKRAA